MTPSLYLKNISVFLLAAAFLWLFPATSAMAQIKHEVFLPNTDHELHVYRINGEEPGNTLMIIGGIQGDEPGGYMTADLYADIHLKKGNLIVVPRANFYSILLNTRNGLTGDMNRKFTPEQGGGQRDLEEEVVTILKHLIEESDCLINLHEGSGFYHPQWISAEENPMKFGQSLIFDTSEFQAPNGKVINLLDLGRRVVERVNPQVANARYQFKLNNHNTLSSQTMHKEQRRSATYYALTVGHIPAFGIETSKSIKSLATKISLHKLVVNSVMAELDITLDTPHVVVDPPQLQYLLVKVNDGYPYALPNGSAIDVNVGDEVVVTDIIANYSRGLVADLEGLGNTNDTRKPFRITKPTKVIVRKDSQKFGWITLNPRQLFAQVGSSSQHVPTPEQGANRAGASSPAGKGEKDAVTAEEATSPEPVKTAALASAAATAVSPAAKDEPAKDEALKKDAAKEEAGKKDAVKPPVAPAMPPKEVSVEEMRVKSLEVKVNGKTQTLADKETLTISRGGMLTMESVKTNLSRLDKDIVVNLKGFNPPKKVNDGNDLSFPVKTDQDLLERFSEDKQGKRYPIVATYQEKVVGEFWLELR